MARQGLIINSFDGVEYQIDELIAFFLSRKGHVDSFLEIISSRLSFNSKRAILKRILSVKEIKKISKLTKSDLNFLEKIQKLRNLVAHGCYLPQDGDMPHSIFSGTKSFDISNKSKVKEIRDRCSEIGKKLYLIQKYWFEKKSELPLIKPSKNESWINLS